MGHACFPGQCSEMGAVCENRFHRTLRLSSPDARASVEVPRRCCLPTRTYPAAHLWAEPSRFSAPGTAAGRAADPVAKRCFDELCRIDHRDSEGAAPRLL